MFAHILRLLAEREEGARRGEEPMLLLIEEGYVAEIGHYLFEYQRLFV